MSKLTMLMILDGFGNNSNEAGNAVELAKTPNIDELMKTGTIVLDDTNYNKED